MHAAFVADEVWGFMPEPARTASRSIVFRLKRAFRTFFFQFFYPPAGGG